MLRTVMFIFFIFKPPSLGITQINRYVNNPLKFIGKLRFNSHLTFISRLQPINSYDLRTKRNRYLPNLSNFIYFRSLEKLPFSSLSKDSRSEQVVIDPESKYDKNDCKIIIKSGVGGAESFDWCRMLYEMYRKFISQYNMPKNSDMTELPTTLRYKEVECSPGNTGGFRRVEIDVLGQYAYRLFKSENGTHRLIRNSPFSSENKRHTTFGSVQVVPILSDTDQEVINFKKNKQILKKDLIIESMRSRGKGGQNVNKVESAVRVFHKPTGLSVKVQQERTNSQNKEIAIRMITKLVEDHYKQQLHDKMDEIRGEDISANWGTHIRTYTLNPEHRVKDHRTELETSRAREVLDGDILEFMLSYLDSEYQ